VRERAERPSDSARGGAKDRSHKRVSSGRDFALHNTEPDFRKFERHGPTGPAARIGPAVLPIYI